MTYTGRNYVTLTQFNKIEVKIHIGLQLTIIFINLLIVFLINKSQKTL